ncbi:MAG: VWA-like domain-containing protein [Chloroflexales bacterium]|nr:VWA-like domain-containing protein [Chloroflexales bacterium]
MELDTTTERLVSAALLRLRMRTPFFATLALFARIRVSTEHPTAATDGRDVFINPTFFQSLDPAQQDAILLHAVLHAALLHVSRRGVRDEMVWNIAIDIVVNGIIAEQGNLDIPPDTARDLELAKLSVEEVYELLRFSPERQPPLPGLDLFNNTVAGSAGDRNATEGKEDGSIASARAAELEAHWRNAFQQANAVVLTTQSGSLPDGMRREIAALEPGRIDWRTHLWRYLVQTPSDFQGFDRRFVGRGLYLEALEGETVRVFVAVDSSGSINDQQIRALVSEVQSILRSYPHLKCDLYYADDKAYGPYYLAADGEIPPPVGGDGADFQPFFAAVEANRNPSENCICVYLTDGFGIFPAHAPSLPMLWVVTPGERAFEEFPFGEAVRLVQEA